LQVVVAMARALRSLSLVRILSLLPPIACSLSLFAKLEKFDSLSGGDPTVFFFQSRHKSASGTDSSKDLRVTRCMAAETWVDYFACWSLVRLCDHFIARCSCGNHHADFHHYFLGSQPILGWDRRIPQSCENVAYSGYRFRCDLLQVTSAIYYEQRLRRQPNDLLSL
jgi:hypothetical protein